MNPVLMILVILGGSVGLLSTLYLTFSLPAIILWKLYRKIRLGIPMTR